MKLRRSGGTPETAQTTTDVLDVALIGGGIMSATLGAILAKLEPDWSTVLIERLDELAGESSGPWNNAGTGHSGLCEPNYMPDPDDPEKPAGIARLFHLSRQFWEALLDDGSLPRPASFLNPAPHMTVAFGERDIAYLRQRYETLRSLPLFSGMEYSEDPTTIAEWAPLITAGRKRGEPLAATRHRAGTDIDFGALTTALTEVTTGNGAQVLLGHQVTGLRRDADGIWRLVVRDRNTGARRVIRARFVFVGAGGQTLRLLQKARIPEVRGYAVFPFGAQFLRTDRPDVVGRHDAKVYGRAAFGAPPMSVPHLDKRFVEGREALLFGPYATFSTRLLKHGRPTELFATLRWANLPVLVAAGLQNTGLVRYLAGQLVATRRRKFAQLRRFYPEADPADWYPIQAGQRAQLVVPDRRKVGILTFGTELVAGADGTIAGLLGASPGASTAPAIMRELLGRCFPEYTARWQPALRTIFPDA
ncbi:malate dehydrogenase (quinone) [Nocardia carnea]|uniref:Probable malate:quinone oxidoreductase n=1 Tax=Nocardia carnea TaxID=37328 RepID=A0ABW7TP20_9NOCA|nr:malate dehydrogenase (quinone) [Nocardia carnea]